MYKFSCSDQFERQEPLLGAEITAIAKARAGFEKLQTGGFEEFTRAPYACVERIHQILDKLGLDESYLDTAPGKRTATEMKMEIAKALRFSMQVAPVRRAYDAVLNAPPESLSEFGHSVIDYLRIALSHDATPSELASDHSRSDAPLTKSNVEMKAEMWKNFQRIANGITTRPSESEQVIKNWIDRRAAETHQTLMVEMNVKLADAQAKALLQACARPNGVGRVLSTLCAGLDR